MKTNILPFLVFGGNANAAMDYYLSVFPDSQIENLIKYGAGERLPEGQILNATITLMGNEFILMDLEAEHAVPFSWSISFYIECDTEQLFDDLFSKLSDGGVVMMGPEPVLHFRKVTWVTDKFGVTWQLVWE